MSKMNVTLNGKNVVINTATPRVAKALQALIEACAERRFGIGEYLTHDNRDGTQTDYQLVRIKVVGGFRAYLINGDTGRARNSRKVVMVKTDDADFENGYVTELPAEKDCFIDEENGGYIDC